MKRILLVTLALIALLPLSARQPQTGYRGFLEWNNSLRSEPSFIDINKNEIVYYSGVSTTHGYQITPIWFAGVGLSVENNRKYDNYIVAAYAQGRADLQFGRFTPFAEARLGYSLSDGGGAYFSPSIGYRFNWGRKLGINIGIGATLKNIKTEIVNLVTSPEGYLTAVVIGSKRYNKGYFSFRVGIDF